MYPLDMLQNTLPAIFFLLLASLAPTGISSISSSCKSYSSKNAWIKFVKEYQHQQGQYNNNQSWKDFTANGII